MSHHARPTPVAESTEGIVLRPWQSGLAPQYITLFLWVAFYDRLATSTLAAGGLAWTALGVVVGGLIGFLFFFYVPAMWGLTSRRSLIGVAEATFGRSGARWLPGGLVGMAQVFWFALGNFFATTYMLEGLAACRLTGSPEFTRTWHGLTLGGPLFLTTALVWTLAFAATARWLLRVIAAIMLVYPIVPAAALGLAMIWNLGGLAAFDPGMLLVEGMRPAREAGRQTLWAMVQWTCGFSAAAGLAAADWGAASRDARDVRVGGLVGMVLAPTIVIILALATVAGAYGRRPPPLLPTARADLDRALIMRGQGPVVDRARHDLEVADSAAKARLTFRSALKDGIGGPLAGGMLIAFALASMAPAVYAAFVAGERFESLGGRVSRTTWTFLAALASYPLVAFGVPARSNWIFGLLGAAFAPVAGAMVADAIRHRGRWPGPRSGVNAAGWLAWGTGLAVGLVPVFGPILGQPEWASFQPSTVYAGLAALVAYFVFASLGLEAPSQAEMNPSPPIFEAEPSTIGM